MGSTYLDYNATSPLRDGVRDSVLHALDLGGNPSSVHATGRKARMIVEDARRAVADLIGGMPEEISFTSGGTESDALALTGLFRPVVTTAIEHDAVLSAVAEPTVIGVESDGIVDLRALDRALSAIGTPALVSVMAANNETGVIQPLQAVAEIAKAHGALVHTDMVQIAGRLPVSVRELGMDLATLSSHKIGGPQGVGALWVADGVSLSPLIRGGGQERGRRAGTENVAGIAGFGTAAQAAAAALADGEVDRIAVLRDQLETRLRDHAPDVRIASDTAERLPNTTAVSIPGAKAETQVMALDLDGFAVSAGAACSSGKVKRSHVLAAMDKDAPDGDDRAETTIRVSLGHGTTEDDVVRFADAWCRLHDRLAKGRNAAA